MDSTTATTSGNRLSITHREFADLVLPVLPHTDTSGSLPILSWVKFETVGGYLTALATDRYTIACSRMKVDDEVQFNVLIPREELRAILAMFKPRRGVVDQLTLTETDTGTLRVEGPGSLFSNAVIEYRLGDGLFPKVQQIFGRMGSEVSTDGHVALNPLLLAKFQHAARMHEPIQVHVGQPKRPVFITSGEHFMGAIMPVGKSDGEKDAQPDWSAVFPSIVQGQLAAVQA